MTNPEIKKVGDASSKVHFKVSKEQLHGLPVPSLYKGRTLLSEVQLSETVNDTIGVAVYALPSKEQTATKFWTIVGQNFGKELTPDVTQADQNLPVVRLRIEPPLGVEDQVWEEHAPISVTNHYVVMEDGTRYGIGLIVPPSLFTDWSEEKARINKLTMEKYRERHGVAVLVRIDGDKPLIEKRGLLGERHEEYGVLSHPEETDRDAFYLVSSRRVHKGKPFQEDTDEPATSSVDAFDLTFEVIARHGTAENTVVDDKGLIEVIFVRIVEEEVTERSDLLSTYISMPADDFDVSGLITRGVDPGFPGVRKAPGESTPAANWATERGETKFTGPRVEKVSLVSARAEQPIAAFRVALVGDGGPITTEMTQANMEQ